MNWLERASTWTRQRRTFRTFSARHTCGASFRCLALDVLCGAETSREEMAWSQDLAIGTAFSQFGLESQASGYFMSVLDEARARPWPKTPSGCRTRWTMRCSAGRTGAARCGSRSVTTTIPA